jgi:hypothetical protein
METKRPGVAAARKPQSQRRASEGPTPRGEAKRGAAGQAPQAEAQRRLSPIEPNPFGRASVDVPLPRSIVVTRAEDESQPLRPVCRLCKKDASNDAYYVRPCLCPQRVHIDCLDRRRVWSPERFSACEFCGWRYRFSKTPTTSLVRDDDETSPAPEDLQPRVRRWCVEWVHGYWFIFIMTHLALVAMANIIHAADTNMVLAEWAHASMDDYTELEVDYACSVCLLGFVVGLVTMTRHGCSSWPVMVAALPALLFCGAIGFLLSPFITFVLTGMMVVHAIHRMVQTDELLVMIYDWPVVDCCSDGDGAQAALGLGA